MPDSAHRFCAYFLRMLYALLLCPLRLALRLCFIAYRFFSVPNFRTAHAAFNCIFTCVFEPCELCFESLCFTAALAGSLFCRAIVDTTLFTVDTKRLWRVVFAGVVFTAKPGGVTTRAD
jgi:hypothetical protein